MGDRPQMDQITLREKLRILGEVAAHRPMLAVAILVLSALVGVLEGVGLGFILPIISLAQDGGGTDPSGPLRVFVEVYTTLGIPFTLEYIVLGVGLVMGVRHLLGVVVTWLSALLGAGYRRYLRVTAFDRALEARTSFFDEHGSDELLNAILTQTGYASYAITTVVRGLELVLVSLAYALVAFYIAPSLMTLTAGILVIVVFGSKYLFESGYDVGGRLVDANERVQRSLQAGIQSIREVKLFSLGDELSEEFHDAVDQHTRASVQRRRDQSALSNLNQFFAAATVFGLVYVGLTASSLSLPSLGVFLFAMFRLAPRVSSLNGLVYDLDNHLPHLVRTRIFLDDLARDHDDWGERPGPESVDRVELRDVGFGYPSSEGTVVEDVSFAVERGEFVAFVGPSGAGKSTIASLLSGLYRPDRGEILADGQPIHEFSADGWHSRIAVVGQRPNLFNATLRYNLTIGNREASDAALDEVCRIAQVDEFLDDLPEGYDTVLGDDGVRLSGGQRQRVAIARALLKDADILVLDEATSELDSHLEARVHDAIGKLDRDYAVVAIAHRLSTVTDADAIHVMERGRIVESGTHERLLATGERYADLYATQVGDTVSLTLGTDD